MTQYYYTDGKERYGPFTIDQLRERNITSDTLVWKEGMPDWATANQLNELEVLFKTFSETNIPGIPIVPQVHLAVAPKNWLVESILVTCLCCLPLGIVGIIYSLKVEDLWFAGRHEEAQRAGREAGKWVKIAFIIGLITGVLFFMMGAFGMLAGIRED